MSDTSVQTSLRQAWFTSVVAIVSIAVLGLILEIAVGSKPVNLFNKLTRAQEGAVQIRMELRLLGKLLADDPKSYPADLSQQLAGMRESMTAGLQLLGKSGLKSDNEKAFEQLEVCFQERFLPDFINFRQPYGDQDRPKIRARLKVSRDDLESRVGVFERSLDQYSAKDLKEIGQIKGMGAWGGIVLGVLGLALLWFQVRSLQKVIARSILQAAPVSGADAKMTENIAKYATRIRELEGSNKLLRSEVDKLAPLADEVVTLRQQGSGSPWEAWLKAIHGRGRSTLGKGGQRTEIVTIGKGTVVSYGLDGTELWRLGGMTQATPSPVAGNGLLYVGSGSQGETGRPLFAIKPGASGNISLTPNQTSNDFVAWFQPRFSGYTPSPLLYRNRVYVINDNGIMQVADATTGKELYKARVGGGGLTFSSSPLASNGRIYAVSEDGDVVVFEAGDEYKELAKNSLGEMSLATPAAESNSLYIRTATKLYKLR